MKLEQIEAGSVLEGLAPGHAVTIAALTARRDDELEVLYLDAEGRLRRALVTREDEWRLRRPGDDWFLRPGVFENWRWPRTGTSLAESAYVFGSDCLVDRIDLDPLADPEERVCQRDLSPEEERDHESREAVRRMQLVHPPAELLGGGEPTPGYLAGLIYPDYEDYGCAMDPWEFVMNSCDVLSRAEDDPFQIPATPWEPEEPCQVDQAAVRAVIDAEARLGRQAWLMPHRNAGYDLESRDPESGHLYFIEVRTPIDGVDTVTFSGRQALHSRLVPDRYILAMVDISTDPRAEPAVRYADAPHTRCSVELALSQLNLVAPA